MGATVCLLAGTAARSAAAAVETRFPDDTTVNVAVVPFRVLHGLPIIRVQIDGIWGNYILDTGASIIVMRGDPPGRPRDKGAGFKGVIYPPLKSGQTFTTAQTVTVGGMTAVIDPEVVHPVTTALSNSSYMRLPALDEFAAQFGAPLAGLLGIEALAPFETIVDYNARRVTFVRLDTKGKPLATVPEYAPAHVLPLERRPDGLQFGVRLQKIAGVTDTAVYLLDTGAPTNSLTNEQQQAWQEHLTPVFENVDDIAYTKGDTTGFEPAIIAAQLWQLDNLRVGGIDYPNLAFSFGVSPQEQTPGKVSLLGTPWLRRLGVAGFNFRARRLTVYTPSNAHRAQTSDRRLQTEIRLADSARAVAQAAESAPRPILFDTLPIALNVELIERISAFRKAFDALPSSTRDLGAKYRVDLPMPAMVVHGITNHPAPRGIPATDMVAFARAVPAVAATLPSGLTPLIYMRARRAAIAAYCLLTIDQQLNGSPGALDGSTPTGRDAIFLRDHPDQIHVLEKLYGLEPFTLELIANDR